MMVMPVSQVSLPIKMYSIATNILTRTVIKNQMPCGRNLFEGVLNKVFNAVDEERRSKLGPDRVCAEWLLKNGAAVKFKNQSEYLRDYNALPEEDFPVSIVEIEAVESSISHYGFPNFEGCKNIIGIKFHKCYTLENEAMRGLLVLKESLKHLCVSNCPDITDSGLLHLQGLKLNKLELLNLPYVKNKDSILLTLKTNLPNCNILFE